MTAVAGVKFTKDAKKNNRYVTIDLKKHIQIMLPILKQLGAVEDEEDEFDKQWKEGITGEEFWGLVNKNIIKHFKQK